MSAVDLNNIDMLKKENLLLRELLQTSVVHNDIHIESINMIKDEVTKSARAIESTFEENLTTLKEIKDDSRFRDNLIIKLDSTISNIHKYISILQCEDKVFQMLDGVSKVLESNTKNIELNNISINDEEKTKQIKNDLVQHYTIQEQRDLASGEVASDDGMDSGELLLF